MAFHRRDMLKGAAALSVASALPRLANADAGFVPQPGSWRFFQVTTSLAISNAGGPTQAWIPLPSTEDSGWFRFGRNTWTTNGKATHVRESIYGAEMLHVEWAGTETSPAVAIVSKIAARDRSADINRPDDVTSLTIEERQLYLSGTELIPVDGIVKETSSKIVAGAGTDVEKARAIYEWVVDNTFRNAGTRGCGNGDIATMLSSGRLGGKCADINGLYVGLARAAGLPARDVFGIRVAPSKFGYRSLGANSENVTKAQHCRSEVYLANFGWVPVDPADVRKVILEEPPTNLAIDDPKVTAARKTLFGAWESNWLPYNFAHDIALPESSGPKIGFLMYPQAEVANLRLDCLDPENFNYTIMSKELTAA